MQFPSAAVADIDEGILRFYFLFLDFQTKMIHAA